MLVLLYLEGVDGYELVKKEDVIPRNGNSTWKGMENEQIAHERESRKNPTGLVKE